MDKATFENIVSQHGKDILRFCRLLTNSMDEGDELYQDTMVKLYERAGTLDQTQNVKSYALSIAIFLWKNKKRKYARRWRIASPLSIEEMAESGEIAADSIATSPENELLKQEEIFQIRKAVYRLPEKYRMIIYLYFSAEMTYSEIAETLHIPEGTVKTRMTKAKKLLRNEMEAYND